MTKNEAKKAFDDFLDHFAKETPNLSTVALLAESPLIMTAEEWLNAFEGPLEITLENELAWPPPKPTFIQIQ